MSIKNTFTTFALKDDGVKSVYDDSSIVSEYNSGFIAGTLINCRTINTGFRMATLVTNAIINALDIKNESEFSIDLNAFSNVKANENADNGVVFTDVDLSGVTSIGNKSNMADVTLAIFDSMRNFKPKFANCAEMVYATKGSESKPATKLDAKDRKYYPADDVFVHKNSREDISGIKNFINDVCVGTGWNNSTDRSNEDIKTLYVYGGIDSTIRYDNSTTDDYITYGGSNYEAGLQMAYYKNTSGGKCIRPSFTIGHNHVAQMRGSAIGWDNIVTETNGEHQYVMCLGNENHCSNANISTVVGTGNKSTNAYVDIFGNGLTSFDDHQTIIGYQNMASAQTKPTGFDNGGFKASFVITANAGNSDSFKTCNMIEGYSWVTGGNTQNHALYINCATYCSAMITSNTFNTTSDKRLKENITDYNYHDSVLDIPVKEFDMKSDGSHHIGCIAQDLQKKYPELVSEDSNGYLRIEETKLVYLLMEEVKLLKARIEALEKDSK